MNEDLPFRDALRQELTNAASRKPRANSRFKGVGKALAVLVIGIISVSLLTDFVRSDSASADVLSVTTVGSVTTVLLKDATARPHQIMKELADAKIRATVVEEPVQNADIGRFVAMSTSGEFEPIAVENGTFSEFRLSNYNGSSAIALHVGRRAAAGESYVVSFNSYAAGGALHCSGVFGSRVSDALGKLSGVPFERKWQEMSIASGTVEKTDQEVADKFVGLALETGPSSIQFFVVSDRAELPPAPVGVADKC